MFSAYGARQHVLGLIIIDDLLYLFHYDLAMQRFEDRHWGLHPHIDPEFGTCLNSHDIILHDERGDIDITLKLLSEERVAHFGLNGWAINLFPVTSTALCCKGSLAAKVFWIEETQKSELEILKRMYEIVERDEDMRGHVPDIVVLPGIPGYLHRSDSEPTWSKDRWSPHSMSDSVSETEANHQAG